MSIYRAVLPDCAFFIERPLSESGRGELATSLHFVFVFLKKKTFVLFEKLLKDPCLKKCMFFFFFLQVLVGELEDYEVCTAQPVQLCMCLCVRESCDLFFWSLTFLNRFYVTVSFF